ncbi:MAG TPA: bifunctional UDP-N-acetylglucosamine diphosphorylase/glucosamine-1-phosphate N-acetyltransferase GlmU [Candidatus Dormibacteraeota bacterium]|nr:bifunctional UDP-N-acetylglucosamine diphosphorylase/glucosamine-1-phosphate N-acetyltransferase GlmU [Candidatus Dormibacteraeota bacterium]
MSQALTAVILAAGHGTRMRSRTPKVLHPICGRPMVDWVVDAVAAGGATEIKAIVSSHHAEVAAHLDPKVEVVYQREPHGTGDAVKQVPAHDLDKGDVLVVNGDSPLLTSETISRVVEEHRRSGAQATIATVDDPSRDDGRVIRNQDGSFKEIVERKDATADQLAVSEFNVGLYCFQGEPLVQALAKITDQNGAGEYYLPDVLAHLDPVTVVKVDDPNEALGINDRTTLAAAAAAMRLRILRRHMLAGVTIVDPASTFIDAMVEIGQDTVVEPFTVVKGRSVIGAECRIGPHAHIEDASIGDRSDCGPFAKLRPGTVVGDDVHVGSFAELVRTKVGRGSKVPHVSYLGDTTLGEDVNIGAGTITANFNGENKNRTEIGDGAFVGVDTMLVAPVKLGKGSRTGAGSVVTKDVPDGATAVGVPARVVRRKAVSSDEK